MRKSIALSLALLATVLLTATAFAVTKKTGSSGPDVMIGTIGADYLDGAKGNDTMSGSGGRDRLLGGDGNDSIRGDTCPVGTGADTVYACVAHPAAGDTIYGNEGNDT